MVPESCSDEQVSLGDNSRIGLSPRSLSITHFSYDLPHDRIAVHPLPERDNSKLLVYTNGNVSEDIYLNIAKYLPPGSLLVFNNTRVVEARLVFTKTTGAQIEIFCLEPDASFRDVSTAMQQHGRIRYKCLIGGASKWKHGLILEKQIETAAGMAVLKAEITERLHDCFVVELSWQPTNLTFAEVLHLFGEMPLPPYLHRPAEEADRTRYQTVYAQHDGSVAAPTAGLHFTGKVFDQLEERQVKRDYVTLHVGAGTFKPVKTEKMEEHQMHAEFLEVDITTIHNLQQQQEPIVAVGTTSLRTLETLYWIGVKLHENPATEVEEICIDQWFPYDHPSEMTTGEALQSLLQWMEEKKLQRLVTKTQLLIAPGYHLRIVDGIITNFHQPNSTLLLLVAAVVGDDWKKIYQHALDNNFRFLSYGDGCLLWNANK